MKKAAKNKLERKDWKDYELQILKVYREKFPKRLVLDNLRITGKHSRRPRQIDVVIFKADGKKVDIIIECKNLSKTVTVDVLDAFYGKLHDLGLKKGIIVTTKGFSTSTKNYAERKGIVLESVDYEYLKDYYYIPPNEVPDIFGKAIRYSVPYCEQCDISILYEIGEVYGMAEYEPLYCPKCKVQLSEIRSDANHRVIKIFRGSEVSEKEIDDVIARHINVTKEEWTSDFFLSGIPITKKDNCFLCKHEFDDCHPTRTKTEYGQFNICAECFMSRRTLLIDKITYETI